jgi:hypothetical protein
VGEQKRQREAEGLALSAAERAAEVVTQKLQLSNTISIPYSNPNRHSLTPQPWHPRVIAPLTQINSPGRVVRLLLAAKRLLLSSKTSWRH